LLNAGEELEEKMRLPDGGRDKAAGQFLRRPNNLLGIVNEPFAAAAIYPAVLAAWIYLAFFFEYRDIGKIVSLIVFFGGFVGILAYDQFLKRSGGSPGPGG
jgi:hypothetical protein